MFTDGVRDKDTVTGHWIAVDLCQTARKGKDRTVLPASRTVAGRFWPRKSCGIAKLGAVSGHHLPMASRMKADGFFPLVCLLA